MLDVTLKRDREIILVTDKELAEQNQQLQSDVDASLSERARLELEVQTLRRREAALTARLEQLSSDTQRGDDGVPSSSSTTTEAEGTEKADVWMLSMFKATVLYWLIGMALVVSVATLVIDVVLILGDATGELLTSFLWRNLWQGGVTEWYWIKATPLGKFVSAAWIVMLLVAIGHNRRGNVT